MSAQNESGRHSNVPRSKIVDLWELNNRYYSQLHEEKSKHSNNDTFEESRHQVTERCHDVTVKVSPDGHKEEPIKKNQEKHTATPSVAEGKSKFNPLGAKIIDAFKEVNPSYKKWFDNTTQRGSADRLIDTHGLELVLQVIAILPKTNKMQYVPTITTPSQLEDKWAALQAALIKKKQGQITNTRPVFL